MIYDEWRKPVNIPSVQECKFNALRSAYYHTERKSFFVAMNRGLNFLIVVLGAGIMVKVADDLNIASMWLELAIVVCFTLQMTFDSCGQANLHAYLQKRCYELLAEIEAHPQAKEEQTARWSATFVALCADEPTQMRALDAICFNRALDALMLDRVQRQRHQLHVSCMQRLLRNVVRFHHTDFQQGKRGNSRDQEIMLKPSN
jgi:hypothetical protein